MKHYKFGSSTAARTDACQQWVAQSEGVPRKESSFAVDGTIVHGILESIALGLAIPDSVEGHPVMPEHIATAGEMWTATETVLENHNMVEWEPEVTATTGEEVGGTLDLVARSAFSTAMLLDYKTGQGVQVSPVENKQILFAAANIMYGNSDARDLVEGVDNFVGVIMQPNRAGELQTKEWEFTREQVEEFWTSHLANIALAQVGEGDMEAGDHCRFCPANGLCDATTGNLLRMAQLDSDDLETLTWALDHIEQVKQTIKAVEEKAYAALENGQIVKGWKLVVGRQGATAWDDPIAALKLLKRLTRGVKDDDGERLALAMEARKVITPTQAKKILKAHEIPINVLDEVTHRPAPKGFTLAPESDKREAVMSPNALAAALNSIT